MNGASFSTLVRRVKYGGKKGRAAKRRLNWGFVWTHPKLDPLWNRIEMRTNLPITTEPIELRLSDCE